MPAKPAGVTATPGEALVVLAWDDPSNATISKWQYAYKTTGSYGDWTDVPDSTATTTAHIVTELTNGTAHTFRLRAVNASGNGTASDEKTATPLAVPAKPTGFAAAPGDGQVSLSWTDPGNSTITSWQYSYKTTGGYGDWTDVPDSTATTTAHIVTELTNGTAHTFRLRAVNASGNGTASDEKTATPLAVPAKPTGFAAAPGDGQVSLSWTDPGNRTITSWQYSYKTTGGYGDWTDVPGSTATTTAYTVTELTNGAAHTFRLRAVNASGNGVASDEKTATPLAAPAKPTGFAAAAGDGQVSLSWTDPGNSTITGWQYSYKTTGGYGDWTDIDGSTATTTAHTVTELTNGTAHTFRLRAVNASGSGAASDEKTATPLAVPTKPTGFAAAAGDGQVSLSWTDPGNSTITGWQYSYKTTGGYGDWTDIDGSTATTTAHTVTELTNGTAHTFRLRAVNASGSGAASDEKTATPLAVPTKPTGFAAAAGDGQVSLSWPDPGNSTITSWQYSYKTTGGYGDWTDIDGSTATTTAHTVTELTNGTAHTFKVRAVNASGNGVASDEKTATPLAVPAKPTGFAAAAGDGQVSLNWTDPGNSTISGWQYSYKTTGSYGDWTDVPDSTATTTAHIVTGLTNGTAHTFKVRAANASGSGAASDEATATPLAVPAKPTGFAAAPGDGQVSLSWTDLGDSTITGWQYSYKTTGGYGDWTDVPDSTATTTAHIVTGLTNGTAHTFKVRTVNASGNGAASDEKTATPLAVPAKPTGFAAAPGDGQVSLSWTDPGNSTIAGWHYSYKTTGGYGDWTDVPDSTATTTAHIVTGLTNGTAHTFKVRTVNASGNGAASDEKTATPLAVPAKPTGFAAAPGDGQVSLSWTDPGNSTITSWQYSYKTTGGYGDWTDIDGSTATTTAHTVTELTNGTAHTFKVRAVNTSGSGAASDEKTATPLAVPTKPTGFAAAAGDGQVSLSWTDPGNSTIAGWQYAYKTTGGYGDWTDVPDSTATTTAHIVTGLTNGTAHTFSLRAVNASGSGAASDEKTATPLAVPTKPTGFAVTAGDGQVSLSWTDPGNSTIARWQYSYKTTGGYGDWTDVPDSIATTTAHIVTGLTNGTAHTFKVRAVNASGSGAVSDEKTVTPLAVPAKPTGLTAVAGAGEVVLSWNDPNDAAITGWEYNRRPAGGEFEADWTFILGSGAATTSHTITLLEIGASYAFKLRAVNASGAGAESDEAAVTLPPVPAKPTGFAAAAGDGQVSLSWTDPGNSTIARWQYSYKTTGGYGDWTDVPDSIATTTAHIVTGLTNGTAHTFKVRAVNASGSGAASDEKTVTPLAVPAKPTGLTAVAGAGEVVLSWNDPNDAAITGWEYNRRPAGGEFEADWTFILGSGAATTSHTITLLEIGASYAFKLRAVNASGAGAESDEAAVTLPPVPAKPTGFAAAAGDGQVSLSWTDPGNTTISGWQYSYKTTGGYGDWTDIDDSTATTTAHIVTGLANGTAYTFRLRAVNASGNGTASDEAAATPLAVPAKPTGLTAVAGAGEVVLSWNDPNDATITGWEYNRRPAGGEFEADWTFILGSGAATTSHTITLLEIGASYAFKLRAVNASGAGAESDEATVTLPPVPAKPTGLTATAGDRRALLEWTALGGSTVTRWQYSYKTTGIYGDWTDIPDSTATTTAHAVTELTNGTAHTFKVRAVNASGNGAVSDEATATPLAVPAKPTGLTAVAGAGEVVLSWNDPNDAAITGWEYNRRPAGGEFEADWTFILGSGAATTSHTITLLEIGASYAFKLRAVNASGAGAESDEVTVTLPAVPAKPTGFAATAGDGQVSLSWTDPGNSTIAGWQYSYRTEGGSYSSWTDIANSGADTAGHTVTGLAAGTPHYFRIRAANSSGEGVESDEAAATPFAVPAKPTGLKATPGSGEVLLEWNDPGDPAIAGWQYNRRRSGRDYTDDWTTIQNSGPATTSYTVTGLEIGVSYGFKVRAVNAYSTGPESDEVATTLQPVPARPEGLVAEWGVNEVSLEWKALGDPSVTRWQYRYRTTGEFGDWVDIPDSHAGTTGHTIPGLEGGTPHTFGIRAANSSGYGLESEGITVVPLPSLTRPKGLKAHAGYGQVMLTWDDPKNPAIIKWQHVARSRADTAPDRWIDISGSTRETTRHVVARGWENDVEAALKDNAEYVFRVRYCISEDCLYPNYSPGSDPVAATPKAKATPAERRAVKAVLASLASHVAAGAHTVIGARFAADPAATRFVLAGREVPLFAPVRKERVQTLHDSATNRTVMGMSGRELLRDSSFQVALGPPGEEGFPQWSLWHRGDLKRFEGSAGPQTRYGGRMLSVWFGADMRWGEKWLFGTAMARSEGELAYGAGAALGAVETTFDSVHPYLQRRFEDGETVWITFGGGRGTIRNTTAGRGVETADAELATVSAGFRGPLPAFRGLELSISGEAGFAQLEARGNARTAIGSLSASADRQSLGIEIALEEEGTGYYSSLSLRRDGGDGVRGLGLELSSGAGSPLPASSGRADIRLRGLAWRSGREYREFGLTATVRQPADANRGGPSWSLAGAYGAPDSRIGESEPFRSRKVKRGGGKALFTLDLKAGWRVVSRRGLFEPHAAVRLAGTDGRQLALGVDLGLLAGPVLKLAAERRVPQTGDPESRVSVAMQFRF